VGYLVVLLAFTTTMGLSLRDMRASASEAELLRAGYVPLQLHLGEALAQQNVLATQLNHVTTAKSSADVREWIDTATRARPIVFATTRATARSIETDDPGVKAFRDEVVRELDHVEDDLRSDPETFARLFQLLSVDDAAAAERVHGELVKREADAALRLRTLKGKVEDRMAKLGEVAHARESLSLKLLVGLSALTLLVGVAVSLYARRLLRPLALVTERAKAVAGGDLTPREVVADDSEIGELAETFESMVSAIKNARAELVQAERLATIGKMAAHITHEIRNPLSSIGLNLELLEGEIVEAPPTEGTKEARELLTAIKKETTRLARISEQYLSVARRPSPTLEVDSVADLARELVAFVKPELDQHHVTAELVADPEAPLVPMDESQLRQALLNLVRNAREAMPGGGRIKISVERAAGGGVDVCIDDEGPGIPEEARASIFDPFFTTKERGTGLGLAVTREIVESHRGVIVCEPREPRGTRFRIHLPSAVDELLS
jgi:signal transduction histidine kinase